MAATRRRRLTPTKRDRERESEGKTDREYESERGEGEAMSLAGLTAWGRHFYELIKLLDLMKNSFRAR